jgi:hypothetical protein
MKGTIVGALIVAVAVLGYLYYQETQDEVSTSIEAPKIETPSTN